MEFTAEHVAWYRTYEAMRDKNNWTMFNQKEQRASGLDPDQYAFVIANYSALQTLAGTTA